MVFLDEYAACYFLIERKRIRTRLADYFTWDRVARRNWHLNRCLKAYIQTVKWDT